jgi:MFS family permease
VAERTRGPIRRLAAARLISSVGTSAADVAIAYSLFQTTRSAYWVSGLYFFTFGVNGLVAPFFGALADRYDRRRLMIASDVVGAALFVALIFVHTPVVVVAVAFAASLSAVPFGTAASAAVPNLAPEGELSWANSLLSSFAWSGRLAGFGVGGALLAATSVSTVLVVNAASFLVSAALIASLHLRFAQERELEEKVRAREGFRFIRADPLLRALVLNWAILFFAVDIVVVGNPGLAQEFRTGSTGFGLLEAMYAAGSLVGAVAGRWMRDTWQRRILLYDAIAIMIGQAIVVVTPWFGLALAAILTSASADSLASVAGSSLVQRKTEDAIRGRVFGALWSAFMAANMVAFTLGGPLTEWLGPRGVYAVGAVSALGAFVILARAFARIPEEGAPSV